VTGEEREGTPVAPEASYPASPRPLMVHLSQPGGGRGGGGQVAGGGGSGFSMKVQHSLHRRSCGRWGDIDFSVKFRMVNVGRGMSGTAGGKGGVDIGFLISEQNDFKKGHDLHEGKGR
jgi:hypothetical protein